MTRGLQVVYVNYRATPYLVRSLQSTLAHRSEVPDLDVTIVDHSSDAAETEHLQAAVAGRAQVIVPRNNDGFARGCNIGASAGSNSEHLLFLNPDTIVPERLLGRLWQALEQHPRSLVGPRQYADERCAFAHAPMRGARLFDEAWDLCFARGWDPRRPDRYLRARGRLDRLRLPLRVRTLSGGCLAMSRSTFEALGGWNEHYWMYGEDVELCVRARRHGFDILYLPDTSVVHFMEISARQLPERVARARIEGRERFKRGRYGPVARSLERYVHRAIERWLPRRNDPWAHTEPLPATHLRAPCTSGERWAVEVARSPLFDNCLTAFSNEPTLTMPRSLIDWLPPGRYFVRIAHEQHDDDWRTDSVHHLDSLDTSEGESDEGPVPVRLDQHVS